MTALLSATFVSPLVYVGFGICVFEGRGPKALESAYCRESKGPNPKDFDSLSLSALKPISETDNQPTEIAWEAFAKVPRQSRLGIYRVVLIREYSRSVFRGLEQARGNFVREFPKTEFTARKHVVDVGTWPVIRQIGIGFRPNEIRRVIAGISYFYFQLKIVARSGVTDRDPVQFDPEIKPRALPQLRGDSSGFGVLGRFLRIKGQRTQRRAM